MNPYTIAAVFAAAIAADYCWGRYTVHMSRHRRHRASLWAVGIALLGLVGTVSTVENHWYALPFAAGCYIGTYLAAKPDSLPEPV